MQRVLAIILITIFFVACSKSVPKGIIEASKMTNILLDLHLAEGYMLSQSAASTDKLNYIPGIYQKYETDSASVRNSLEYYASHPQELQDMYAEISKRLHAMETAINDQERQKGIEMYKADSIERRVVLDSIYFLKRDSILRFNGPDNLIILKADSVNAPSKDWSLAEEQNRLELMFGYPIKQEPIKEVKPQPSENPKETATVSKEPLVGSQTKKIPK